ncbi:MAG: hypothetical protein SynsKO_30940 [Synoicihabitans sp.]
MKLWTRTLGIVLLLAGLVQPLGAEAGSLHAKLESFRPLLGKTWAGEFPPSPSGAKVTDVVRFERALNGSAVRALHSLNDGAYGGETLFLWDESAGELVFYYFTTQGFVTKGVMKEGPKGTFVSVEKVDDPAKADGVSEVKSEFVIEKGRYVSSSQYLKAGEWVPGHGATYLPAPDREVKFR